MKRKLLENDQLPIEDKELFERMRHESCSDNERIFFEKMEYKELYEYPISSFDVILSEFDNDEGIYFVKCYTSESINLDVFFAAEIVDFKSLVFNGLFVTADSYISVNHNIIMGE